MDINSIKSNLEMNNFYFSNYSFIRSQITLMTSQPGMTPIVLPTINTAKL